MWESCRYEACGETELQPPLDTIIPDRSYGGDTLDLAIFQCSDGSRDTIPARDENDTGYETREKCWNCWGTCAGDSCPSGATCAPVLHPHQPGSDCRALTCDSGWVLTTDTPDGPTTTFPEAAQCVRPVPGSIHAAIEGPTEIQPDDECTWTAEASGFSGSYTFTWYNENIWMAEDTISPTSVTDTVQSFFSDGKPNGTVGSQFTIKVLVNPVGYSLTRSEELEVTEDPDVLFACPS